MSYVQRQTAERYRGVDAARRWAEANGHDSHDGFPEWCWDTGRDDDHAAAYGVWMASPARIERWAERHGVFVGKGFARWYLEEQRTGPFAEAYREYRALLETEAWNHRHPEGAGQTGRTRSAASVLSGHTAVVWVTGHAACIALAHVQPIPESEV